MNTFLLLSLLVAAFATPKYLITQTYSDGNCGQTTAFAATTIGVSDDTCNALNGNCLGANGISVKAFCSDTYTLPDGIYGYETYQTSGCFGDPETVVGIGSNNGNCQAEGIEGSSISYKVACGASGGQTFTTWANNDCSGTPTSSSNNPFGCISTGDISINQISCQDGTLDVTTYLDGWLQHVDQSWSISNFDASKQPCYQGHGSFTVDSATRSVSVSVTIGQCDDTQIKAFVDAACDDFSAQASAGTCANAKCGGAKSVQASCTWSFQTKRDAQQSAITMTSNLTPDNAAANGGGSSGASSLMFPLFALMLSAFAFLF